MPKFKSKPVEILAEQYVSWYQTPWPEGVQLNGETDPSVSPHAVFVVTAHKQRVYLEPGDWVVKEPNGEGYYPVKDAIFQQRWEIIESQ